MTRVRYHDSIAAYHLQMVLVSEFQTTWHYCAGMHEIPSQLKARGRDLEARDLDEP